MSLFSNLKVTHRLSLIYAVVILCSLGMYAMVQYFVAVSGTRTENLFSHEISAQMLTLEISGEMNMVSRLSRNIMLGTDLDKDFGKIKEKRTLLADRFSKLQKTAATDAEQAMIKQAAESTLAFVDKVIVLVEAMRPLTPEMRHTAFQNYEKEATPLAVTSREHFGTLLKNVDKGYLGAISTIKADKSKLVTTLNIAMPLYLVFLTVVILLIVRSIAKPLRNLTAMLEDITQGDGDLTKRLDASGTCEFGQIASRFNVFMETLQTLIANVNQKTADMVATATELDMSSDKMLAQADLAAGQTVAVATASEEMSATTADIARSCMHAAERADEAGSTAQNGATVVQDTLRSMQVIADNVRETAETIKGLGSRSDQIGAIVGTIEDIADQTNLLALNAAIEAARAGEMGRGFAVVADEVRALAERTTRATREIAEMIKAIQQETAKAVNVMEEGVSQVEKGTHEAARSGEALDEILSKISDVSQEINQIATAAEELTATNHEVTGSIHNISDLVQQTNQQTTESVSRISGMIGMFEGLQGTLNQFKCNEDLPTVLQKAKSAHLLFTRRIRLHLKGELRLDAHKLPDHHTCAFGSWYDHQGQEVCGGHPSFRSIIDPHQKVHALGKAAIQAHDSGDKLRAQQLCEEMIAESHRLLAILANIK
jgi:methyl-accepting chemotaxis protein